jgi:hypothetical protein
MIGEKRLSGNPELLTEIHRLRYIDIPMISHVLLSPRIQSASPLFPAGSETDRWPLARHDPFMLRVILDRDLSKVGEGGL